MDFVSRLTSSTFPRSVESTSQEFQRKYEDMFGGCEIHGESMVTPTFQASLHGILIARSEARFARSNDVDSATIVHQNWGTCPTPFVLSPRSPVIALKLTIPAQHTYFQTARSTQPSDEYQVHSNPRNPECVGIPRGIKIWRQLELNVQFMHHWYTIKRTS